MTLELRWMPLWLLAIVLPTLLVAAVVLYRRDRRLISPSRGWILTGARAALVGLTVGLLLDPALVDHDTEVEKDEVLVVVDISRSMSLPASTDADRPASRIDRVRELLASDGMESLSERFRVTFCSLDRQLAELDGKALLTRQADGTGTDLGEPLFQAVLDRPPGSVAAVVLLSDGNHNASRDPRSAARALARLGTPVFAVGVGPEEPPVDLTLLEVDSTGEVFAGDQIDIEVAIDNHGVDVSRISLVVRDEDADADISKFVIEDLPRQGVSRWPLRFVVEEPGRRKLSVTVEPVAGEATAENNGREFWLDVRSARARVLHVAGSPRWEYRYLRNTWERDANVDVDVFLVPPPPERRLATEFPRARERLFEYDVIVLGDVEPTLFTESEQITLVDFVRARGGTLILLAGPHSMPYGWVRTPLVEVVPVELLPSTPGRDSGTRTEPDGDRFVLTAAGEESSITRLVAGRERNVELWDLLPGPRWVQPVHGLRDGSKALVNARGARVPIFATGVLGAGRVFYSGVDSTWRWRFRFGDLLYTRFWGQVVRWAVANRLTAEDEHARVGTDSVVYEPGDSVEIAAMILDRSPDAKRGRVDAIVSAKGPSTGPALTTDVSLRVSLDAVPKSGGRYRGRLDAEALGALVDEMRDVVPTSDDLRFSVTLEIEALPDYSAITDRARALFAVHVAQPSESVDLSCDRALLEDLASHSGGEYETVSAAGSLLSSLPHRRRERAMTRTLAAIDWPWTLAGLFVTLLCLEWILRKRWNLA